MHDATILADVVLINVYVVLINIFDINPVASHDLRNDFPELKLFQVPRNTATNDCLRALMAASEYQYW